MRAPEKFIQRYVPYEKCESRQWPQVIAIFISCFGCFTLGALFCWPSPSIPILISNSSHIDTITIEEASYFSVIPPIAAVITAPFVAELVDAIGRKKTVMLIAVPQFLSWILIGFAENILVFYLARFLTGIGEACLFGALPTYIGEIATPHVRGSWGNLVAFTIYFGELMVNIIGAFCNIRVTAFIFACVPVLHVLFMALLPESPYFLFMKGKDEEARISLSKLRWTSNVDNEFIKMKKDVQRQIAESGTFKDLLTIPVNRKALLISIAIRGCQQLSGLSAFAIYTQHIFNQAGGHVTASLSAIIFCGILVVAISSFAFVVDKFGRKPLMIFSCFSCGIVLLIEATYFYISQETNIDVSHFRWVPLAGMIAYIICCSSGLGIIPTLMLSELFSASVKAKALCILNLTFSVYVLSISKMYQSLSHAYGMYVPFYLFSICCFGGSIFSYYGIPETKGKTLEEIQQSLEDHRFNKEAEIIKC